MTNIQTCNICCENISSTIRREVLCPYCQFSSCLVCFKHYLLDNSRTVADCMSCHRDFSLDFITSITPKSFHNNEYRKKRAQDLLSQERSLLPQSQEILEDRRRQKKVREEYDKEIHELQNELAALDLRRKEIKKRINIMKISGNIAVDQKENIERKKFIKACPVNDCRGFLSSAWKCGTCETYCCPQCHEPKNDKDDPDHNCDPNSVETAKLLSKECKPCPKCAVPIYKIDGCDQMWCIECKTPFSWRSGKIVNGVVHNPHYYQWQRDQNNGIAPRVPGDNPVNNRCNVPEFRLIQEKLKNNPQEYNFWNFSVIDSKRLLEFIRLPDHIRNVMIIQYNYEITPESNLELRIKFLDQQINEQQWLYALKKSQKRVEYNRAISNILEITADIFMNLLHMWVDPKQQFSLQEEVEKFRAYANREMIKVKQKFNIMIPYLNSNFRYINE